MNLTPSQFEKLVGRLLRKMGLEDVEVTRVYRDGGVDAFGTVVVGSAIRIHMAVQAKKWKPNVQRPVVASVRGSSNVHHRGLIITTSDFSSGAKEEASLPDREPVELMNGSQLVDALVEYEIGVERAPYNLLSLSPEGLLADE
jgi:restriction system protein